MESPHAHFQVPAQICGDGQEFVNTQPSPTNTLNSSRNGNVLLDLMHKQTEILEKLSLNRTAASTHSDSSPHFTASRAPEPYRLNSDINIWLSLFDTYMNMSNVPDRLKASFLLQHIGTDTYGKIIKCGWPRQTFENYILLTGAIRGKFEIVESLVVLRNKFSSAQRNLEESCSNYADRIRDLLARAYPGSDFRTLEQILVNQFMKGLKLPRATEALMLDLPRI